MMNATLLGRRFPLREEQVSQDGQCKYRIMAEQALQDGSGMTVADSKDTASVHRYFMNGPGMMGMMDIIMSGVTDTAIMC